MDAFNLVLAGYLSLIPDWIEALATLVTGATALTLLTKTENDDNLIAGVLRFLNILAGNFGNNRNADDEG